jgi:hypothetical protein
MSRSYYLQLPEDLVPQVLFEQEVRSRRVSVVFESSSGHAYRITANDNPDIKLYSLNSSIGKVASDLAALVDEVMRVRAEMTGIAAHMGLMDEVPSEANGKSWIDLGSAMHQRIHDVIGLTTCVAGSGPSVKKGN